MLIFFNINSVLRRAIFYKASKDKLLSRILTFLNRLFNNNKLMTKRNKFHLKNKI